GGVVIDKLLLAQPCVDGVAADRERPVRTRTEVFAKPCRIRLERVRGRFGGGSEGALGRALERGRVREHRRRGLAEELRTAGNRAEGGGAPLRRGELGVEVCFGCGEHRGRLAESFGER